MASVAVEDNFAFAAAALSALTDKKIVLKIEYDQIQKRIRKGEDTGYVCKGKVDVVEEIIQTYAKTAAIMTGQTPELVEQEEIMPCIPETGATFSGGTRTRNKTRSTSISPIDNDQKDTTNDKDKYKLLKQSEEFQISLTSSSSYPPADESKDGCSCWIFLRTLLSFPSRIMTTRFEKLSIKESESEYGSEYEIESTPSDRQSLFMGREETREPVMPRFRSQKRRTEGNIDLLVIQQSGKTIVVTVESENCSIGQLKEQIQLKTGFLKSEQILHFGTSLLRNDATLHEYDISSNSTIHLSLKIRGGNKNSQDLYFLDPKYLDPSFDYDFTNMTDDGTKYERGGYAYHRPYGWKRLAINVLGKYNNDDWLVNTEKSKGEWAVSYHGTKKEFFNPISEQGFKIGSGAAYGKGVYSSPKIEVAQCYSKKFTYKGGEYDGILQNRVNPSGIRIPEDKPDYWICSDPKDIRPYALCVRKS